MGFPALLYRQLSSMHEQKWITNQKFLESTPFFSYFENYLETVWMSNIQKFHQLNILPGARKRQIEASACTKTKVIFLQIKYMSNSFAGNTSSATGKFKRLVFQLEM